MGLDFAVDQLYATGWTTLDTRDCERLPDARPYPTPDRVAHEFKELGHTLHVTRIQLFSCYRASWTDSSGCEVGAVVGHTAEEAAVFALSQIRRNMCAAAPEQIVTA